VKGVGTGEEWESYLPLPSSFLLILYFLFSCLILSEEKRKRTG
jgi:hypothetical protein